MTSQSLEPDHAIETLRALIAGVSGIEKYEIFVRRIREQEVRAKNQNLSELRDEALSEVSVRFQNGGNCVVAAGSDFSHTGLKELVKRGRGLLRGAQAGPMKQIIASTDVPIEMESGGSFAEIPIDEKISRTLNMSRNVMKSSGRYLKEVKATYFEKATEEWMWTAGGRSVLSHKNIWGAISARALHEQMEASQGFKASELKTQYFDLDWTGVARDAAEGANLIDGAHQPLKQKSPALISSQVMLEFLKLFSKGLRGDRVLKGTSFLDSSDVGKRIFPEVLQIEDDPERSARPGFRFWDAEGLMTQKQVFVEDGVLKRFAFDNSAGWSEGIGSNRQAIRPYLSSHPRPGFHAVAIVPTSKDVVDLRREVESGVWLKTLDSLSMLQPGTGQFVASFSGATLKKGEVDAGLTRIIVRGDLKSLFSKIVSIARDIHWGEHWGSPSVLVSEIDIIGA